MSDRFDIPQWEFTVIIEVSERWEITGTEAENFLIAEGVFEQ